MQTSLFDQNNLSKIAFNESLEKFDLAAAQTALANWGKTLDAPADLKNKFRALTLLKEYLNIPPGKLKIKLAELWLDYQKIDFLNPLKANFKFFHRGLNKALEIQLTDTENDFILPGLHPAQIFINAENFDLAVKSCEHFLRVQSENTFVRELLGFAYLKLGKEKKGLIAYTFALFNNPLDLSVDYLLPKKYKNKFIFLKKKFGDQKQAWLHLPLALWTEGQTYIDPKAHYYEQFLRERSNREEREGLNNQQKITIYFIHILYLAEILRLNNRGPHDSQRLRELQKKLQEISPAMFNSYLNVLKSFRNF